MQRFIFALFILLIFTINLAISSPGKRQLPEKMSPLWIKKVFQSPVGEVQFVSSKERESIFLRTSGGAICELVQVAGDANCQNFADINKQDRINARCVFSFEKGGSYCRHRIYSYEMKESDLFQVIHSIHHSKSEVE